MNKTAARIIKKEHLAELLEAESGRAHVFVPTNNSGHIELAPYEKGIDLDFSNAPSRLSPKSFFFPQTETLYRFDFDTIEPLSEEEESARQAAVTLFAVRPCDASSFSLLDQVFGPENHGYKDPYYQERRDSAIIVALACNHPCSTCFCTTVGGDPAGTRGADVLASDLDDQLYLTSVSDRGAAFLDRHSKILTPATTGDDETADTLASNARDSMQTIDYDSTQTKRNLDDGFGKPVWERITNSCIGCGACTYVCPTCHCFDIADEERHYKGHRIRTWDSCQYGLFTKHASGHNPRPTKTERLRQRFMHKFSYTVETVNEVYCVGCGRCVQHCPVNLDIREVLQEFSS